MKERVGIVAVAQTTYEGSHDRWRSHELTSQTVDKVVEETGLTWAKDGSGIDATVTCSNWLMEGRAIANVTHGDVAGSHLRTEVKVSTEGINAVAFAMIQILSGHHDVILVTACCKESNANQSIIDNFCFEPVFHQKLGLDFVQAAALGQMQYMHRYGISREQCARVVVKNRKNGLSNPQVRFGASISPDEVMNAPFLSYPITAKEVRPACDGACSLILAREDKARKLTGRPVWITGMGQSYDAHFLGDRDLAEPRSLQAAAKQAYKMAGISNPGRDINLFEISEHYAYEELLWTEALGLCGPGGAGRLVDSGGTQIGGATPVNPSGGVLSGNPRMVAGMVRVVEGALQLRGEAGGRQVEGARRALAHGSNGPCGQEQCVLILEKGF
ncbi:MAG: thiolase family protein [Chloroflexi bacterium]|nr:thiolase family protein [Chloroflexota bacterium]